jgi:hypothetical protein
MFGEEPARNDATAPVGWDDFPLPIFVREYVETFSSRTQNDLIRTAMQRTIDAENEERSNEYFGLSTMFDEDRAANEARLDEEQRRLREAMAANIRRIIEEERNEFFGMSIMFDEDLAARRAAAEQQQLCLMCESLSGMMPLFALVHPITPRVPLVLSARHTLSYLRDMASEEDRVRIQETNRQVAEYARWMETRGIVATTFPVFDLRDPELMIRARPESYAESQLCEVSDRRTFCRFIFPSGLFGPKVTTFLALKMRVEQFVTLLKMIAGVYIQCVVHDAKQLETSHMREEPRGPTFLSIWERTYGRAKRMQHQNKGRIGELN